MRPRFAVLSTLWLVATWFHGLAVYGQLPQTTLNWIFPPGASAGSTQLLTVSGTHLDEPIGLWFSDTRVTAVPEHEAANQFKVHVPLEVPESLVEVRFSGRFGMSNPRTFAISHQTNFIASASHTSRESATDLPLDTVANSRIYPGTLAWFRFRAKSGQALGITVDALRLHSRLLPDLSVTDEQGRELYVVRRQEHLDFVVPTSGIYYLKLHDATYRGGDDFYYRTHLSSRPRLQFALPTVLHLDETHRVTLVGHRLPGGTPSPWRDANGTPMEQTTANLRAPHDLKGALDTDVCGWTDLATLLTQPASVALVPDSLAWRLRNDSGYSNPLLFRRSTLPIVTSYDHGLVSVELPCEFSSVFPPHGTNSGVTFTAEQGEVFWLEITAHKLGFPCSPQVIVQRVVPGPDAATPPSYVDVLELNGTDINLGDREFPTQTHDATARFQVPESATYRVLVQDAFNLGIHRPRYPYILSLRRASPDFQLVTFPLPHPRADENRTINIPPLSVRREQTIALKVLAFRRDGFDHPIVLTATNLPAGVTSLPSTIPSGQTSGTLLLTASSEAAGHSSIRVQGTALTPEASFQESNPPGSNPDACEGGPVRISAFATLHNQVADFNLENANPRLEHVPIISVITSELAPVTLHIAEPLTASQDTPLEVPIRIIRREGFTSAFKLKPAGHPALDKAPEMDVGENVSEIVATLALNEPSLPVGTHNLWFQGTITGQYRNNPEAVVEADKALAAATEALASANEAEKPEAEAKKQAAEATKKQAEERAKPRDVRVPVWSPSFQVTVSEPNKPQTQL
jgi:hypothetical protein